MTKMMHFFPPTVYNVLFISNQTKLAQLILLNFTQDTNLVGIMIIGILILIH